MIEKMNEDEIEELDIESIEIDVTAGEIEEMIGKLNELLGNKGNTIFDISDDIELNLKYVEDSEGEDANAE